MHNKVYVATSLAVMVGIASYLGWWFSAKEMQVVDSSVLIPLPSESSAEPDVAAALGPPLTVNGYTVELSANDPLKFGGLVGGVGSRFIQLTPDGTLISGDTTQSVSSRIGIDTLAIVGGQARYQISPGRLTFDVKGLQANDKITVDIQSFIVQSGVRFSAPEIDTGPGHDPMLTRIVSPTSTDTIVFNTNGVPHAKATVDLVYGGRLEIADGVSGDIEGQLIARIDIERAVPAVLARVYEHWQTHPGGPGRFLEIVQEGQIFGVNEIRSALGANPGEFSWVSSFIIEPGYELKACTGENLNVICVVYTGTVSQIPRQFNDRFRSLVVQRR